MDRVHGLPQNIDFNLRHVSSTSLPSRANAHCN
jgi:hypothetical protein